MGKHISIQTLCNALGINSRIATALFLGDLTELTREEIHKLRKKLEKEGAFEFVCRNYKQFAWEKADKDSFPEGDENSHWFWKLWYGCYLP